MTIEVTIKTPEDVKYLNDVAFDYGDKVLVSNGLNYTDARSILALFAFVGKTVNLVFPDHSDINRLNNIVKKLAVLA